MDRKEIAGIVILLACYWGSAALFYGIGIWACKRKTPMHFWAGTEVDPSTISDIPAYNRANGKMWKLYSIPYWIAGLLSFWAVGRIAALILLTLACTVGLWWLIRRYRSIEKQYGRA